MMRPGDDVRSARLGSQLTSTQKVERIMTLEDLLADIRDFHLDGYVDVDDGEDGTPQPNFAMRICTEIDNVLRRKSN